MNRLISNEEIEQKIFFIRGQKVMIDVDLAKLYGTTTKRLNEQVKRNRKRFPISFMFQLSWQEAQNLRSQIATLKQGANIKYLPYAFTEHGVAMLASILRSKRAVKISIHIIDTFVRLRRWIATHKDLAHKLSELERKIEKHDESIHDIFRAIRQLMEPPLEKPKRRIGF